MHSIGKPFVKFYKKHKRSRGNQKEITPVLNLKDDLKEKLCKKISLGKVRMYIEFIRYRKVKS